MQELSGIIALRWIAAAEGCGSTTGEQSTTMMDVVEKEGLGLEIAAGSCCTMTLRRSALSPFSSCEATRPKEECE